MNNPKVFPSTTYQKDDWGNGLQVENTGIDLLDYFAAKALSSDLLLNEEQLSQIFNPHATDIAKAAYRVAKAMLIVREEYVQK